ncbi:hypothetical protein [Methylobacterium nodulans]|uniref:hypothetical protein n=1 Tax=Methylobacterium nodulans TaxID=114616 RepID=UPI0012EDB3B0|nr:hypothetical protein [Methylobacterium nodulans]
MGRDDEASCAILIMNGVTFFGRVTASEKNIPLIHSEGEPQRKFEHFFISFDGACAPIDLWLAVDERQITRSASTETNTLQLTKRRAFFGIRLRKAWSLALMWVRNEAGIATSHQQQLD